jgi:hypothetical protein
VLTVNSAIAILRGLAEAPGEVPVWGPLAVTTAVAAMLLLANIVRQRTSEVQTPRRTARRRR